MPSGQTMDLKKSYGKLIMQTFYKIEYLFTVNNNVFIPKPKVKSAVVKMLKKKLNFKIFKIKESIFFNIVKTAFLYTFFIEEKNYLIH
ncbi:MAG: rRNA adenine N-6-methyltransferase family protein [Candidatus Karelsulcia muelleri]